MAAVLSFVLPIAGAFATSPWVAAGIALAGGLLGSRGQKMHTHNETGRVNDLQAQFATIGAPIIRGYGTVRVAGNVIWCTKFTEHITEHTQSLGGGKGGGGGGGSITTTEYSYSVSFATAICTGPIKGIKRIWADGVEIKDNNIPYSLYKGTEDQDPDPFMEGIEGAGTIPAYRGIAYVVIKNLNITKFGNRIPSLSFEVEFPENRVAQIIKDVSENAGINPAWIETSAMRDMNVDGFIISGDGTFRSSIEALQSVFSFDGFEYDGKIVFRPRDFSDVVGIAAADLGAYETSPPGNAITAERTPEAELPHAMKLSYISKDRNYQESVASYTKTITTGIEEKSISTNVILSDARALQVVEQHMKEAWVNRTQLHFTLSNKYLDVQPGRIVEVPYNGRAVLAMVNDTSYGMPGLNEISAMLVTRAAYTATPRTPDVDPLPLPPIIASPVRLEAMDIPLLPNMDAGSNVILVAATGKYYYGANLLRSEDGGASFSIVKGNIGRGIIGDTLTALPAGNPYTWDRGASVEVKIITGTLASRPEIDILNGANLCLVGDELIQFQAAQLIAENTYRLSILLRGRCGTERHIETHKAGDRFVLIAQDRAERIEMPSSEWFKPRLYRYGSVAEDVTGDTYKTQNFTAQGIGAMPLAPCHIEGRRTAGGDLIIKWTRRTRGDGGWKDHIDVPLNETAEKYECCILKEGAEVRTIGAASPAATYTADMQRADFGGVQERVTVRIYQISDARGRGFPREEII